MTDDEIERLTQEMKILRRIANAADGLYATFVHLRKGLLTQGAADRIEVSVETYDDLREQIMAYELWQEDGIDRGGDDD